MTIVEQLKILSDLDKHNHTRIFRLNIFTSLLLLRSTDLDLRTVPLTL